MSGGTTETALWACWGTALCEGLYPGPGERLVAEACVMSTLTRPW